MNADTALLLTHVGIWNQIYVDTWQAVKTSAGIITLRPSFISTVQFDMNWNNSWNNAAGAASLIFQSTKLTLTAAILTAASMSD